jgi:photosynthetic reaction center H subunit
VEVELSGNGRKVLLPVPFARIKKDGITVNSIYAAQFQQVPGTQSPDQVTSLEEDKISSYYGGGTLYADPKRAEPLV